MLKIFILHFVGPAVISLALSEWFRKRRWIKEGDMRLKLTQ